MAHTSEHTEKQARTLPSSVARIVDEFEGRSARVISTADVAKILGLSQSHPQVRQAIRTLREHHWILPLPVLGTYEFLAGASGPYSMGDVWIELRAALARDPSIRAQVGLGSAAFLRSLSSRRPDPEILFAGRAHRVASLERTYQVIHVLPERLYGQ